MIFMSFSFGYFVINIIPSQKTYWGKNEFSEYAFCSLAAVEC
jgi:hypothetical protein